MGILALWRKLRGEMQHQRALAQAVSEAMRGGASQQMRSWSRSEMKRALADRRDAAPAPDPPPTPPSRSRTRYVLLIGATLALSGLGLCIAQN